jgi:three-Cys-motif partner protein
MASREFFKKEREWSARKHRILTEYLSAFFIALSGQTKKGFIDCLYYVDCFAGTGLYELPDGSTEPGSPVLAAQIAQKLGYPIKCINIESDPKNYASLVKNTELYKNIVINLRGTIEEHLNAILAETRNDSALFFLDPFGVKDIPIDGIVDSLAHRRRPTDVLIRYAPITVRRLCGTVRKDPQNGPKNAAHLDKLFASRDWRDIASTVTQPKDLDAPLLDLYINQLTNIPKGRFTFAGNYRIQTINDKLKYFLVFATGHQLGAKMMSSVFYQAEEYFIDAKEAEQARKATAVKFRQLSLFEEPLELSEEELFALKIDQIAASIKNVGTSKAMWTYEDLFYELILSRGWFGRASEKLFRLATKKLEDEGKIIKELGPRSGKTKLTIKP